MLATVGSVLAGAALAFAVSLGVVSALESNTTEPVQHEMVANDQYK